MPRPKATEPRDQQLLLRLTARQYEMLESVAHLERSTTNAYVHQLLVGHLTTMANNRRVKADVANRAAYDADAAVATRLRDRTRSETEAAPMDSTQPSKRPNSS